MRGDVRVLISDPDAADNLIFEFNKKSRWWLRVAGEVHERHRPHPPKSPFKDLRMHASAHMHTSATKPASITRHASATTTHLHA